jgi:hypothetical protein
MLCTVRTVNNVTDILRWYKNKNISKSFVPFVPSVPRFFTIYGAARYIEHDIYEYLLTFSLIYNILIYIQYPLIASMIIVSRYNRSSLWGVKARYTRYRWYKASDDNFISVPLENFSEKQAVRAVQNGLAPRGIS